MCPLHRFNSVLCLQNNPMGQRGRRSLVLSGVGRDSVFGRLRLNVWCVIFNYWIVGSGSARSTCKETEKQQHLAGEAKEEFHVVKLSSAEMKMLVTHRSHTLLFYTDAHTAASPAFTYDGLLWVGLVWRCAHFQEASRKSGLESCIPITQLGSEPLLEPGFVA